jgi:hypothetical protein
MTETGDRFRSLPEPVRPEDTVETVDVGEQPPGETESQARDRMLREAGGA